MLGFGKKKAESIKPPPMIPPFMPAMPAAPVTQETTTIENVKAKMDLVLSRLDSMRTQQEVLNDRIASVEKILKELYAMAKS